MNLGDMFDLKGTRLTPSTIALILANLVPIFGITMWGWDAGAVLLLYWAESVIVGLLNVPKMLMAQGEGRVEGSGKNSFSANLFLCGFFAVHYGMFCFGHATFLQDMINIPIEPQTFLPGGLLFWAALSIFLSHLFSMMVNFVGKQEYLTRHAGEQMFTPYGRIFIMQVVVIFGGMLMISLGNPLPGVIILVVLKILIDLAAHTAEHNILTATSAPEA